MNPLLVESALATALGSDAFTGTTIYLGTDYQELIPESLNLIVNCGQLDHSVGGLYKADVTIKIISPALLGSDSKATFVETLNILRAALTNAYLGDTWPTGDTYAPAFGGIWITSTKTNQEDNTWIAEINAIVGVTEVI